MDSDGEGSARRPRGGAEVAALTGVVTAQLPSGLYRVRLDGGGGRAGASGIVAHIADRIDRNFVRVLVGDRVTVELSPADLGRGRIVGKLERRRER